MLSNQKDKFKLPENITYFNGASRSPILKIVEKIGHELITKETMPHLITIDDFFIHTEELRKKFTQLIDAPDYLNTAVISSASYGLATVANNIKLKSNDEILVINEQFPSNYYVWKRLADKYNAALKTVKSPIDFINRGKLWNEAILQSINKNTAVVAMGPCHWADGTIFDLKAIRQKATQNDALLIIDGSQNIGAVPFSVQEIQPDALITVGYKWLLGLYSMGMAYYSDRFNDGIPLEENWINRKGSEDFKNLVNYQEEYQPKAGRYNMGERSQFIAAPMLTKSIEQLLEWQPKNIQTYCDSISATAIDELRNLGCFIEEDNYRRKHLFGVYLPKSINLDKLKTEFSKNNIYVSFRGNAIRVSSNVYNTESDFEKLVACFRNV